VITGTATGSTTEAGGFGNAIPGLRRRTGDLNATDRRQCGDVRGADRPSPAPTAPFSIDAAGRGPTRSTTTNADVEALGIGDTLQRPGDGEDGGLAPAARSTSRSTGPAIQALTLPT